MFVLRICHNYVCQVTLTTDPAVRTAQTSDKIWVSYEKLHGTVSVGSRILLDDGAVEVQVESKGTNHGEVLCRVMNQGMLGNKKGKVLWKCFTFIGIDLIITTTIIIIEIMDLIVGV